MITAFLYSKCSLNIIKVEKTNAIKTSFCDPYVVLIGRETSLSNESLGQYAIISLSNHYCWFPRSVFENGSAAASVPSAQMERAAHRIISSLKVLSLHFFHRWTIVGAFLFVLWRFGPSPYRVFSSHIPDRNLFLNKIIGEFIMDVTGLLWCIMWSWTKDFGVVTLKSFCSTSNHTS